MEFDKSKVYSAVNADKVKVGSKVIGAFTISALKTCVKNDENIFELKDVLSEYDKDRFRIQLPQFQKDFSLCYLVSEPEEKKFCRMDWQKGAEFGYNKANEWHYMKDVNCYEDLHFPPEEDCKGRICIWKVQVITEKGIKEPVCYHCGSYDDLWYEINAYHVIAWKEIVPPKEIKEK